MAVCDKCGGYVDADAETVLLNGRCPNCGHFYETDGFHERSSGLFGDDDDYEDDYAY